MSAMGGVDTGVLRELGGLRQAGAESGGLTFASVEYSPAVSEPGLGAGAGPLVFDGLVRLSPFGAWFGTDERHGEDPILVPWHRIERIVLPRTRPARTGPEAEGGVA